MRKVLFLLIVIFCLSPIFAQTTIDDQNINTTGNVIASRLNILNSSIYHLSDLFIKNYQNNSNIRFFINHTTFGEEEALRIGSSGVLAFRDLQTNGDVIAQRLNLNGQILTANTPANSFESLGGIIADNNLTAYGGYICNLGNCYLIGPSNNESWNQSFADTLYAPNTTAGIQYLINSTGIYSQGGNSSWNESYANSRYALNSTLGDYVLKNGSTKMTGTWDVGNKAIINLSSFEIFNGSSGTSVTLATVRASYNNLQLRRFVFGDTASNNPVSAIDLVYNTAPTSKNINLTIGSVYDSGYNSFPSIVIEGNRSISLNNFITYIKNLSVSGNATIKGWLLVNNITSTDTSFLNNLNVSGNTITNNITSYDTIFSKDFNASGYYYGQPLTGMLGSGIIWANGTNNFAEVNVNCSGLSCSYSAFKVRLINSSQITKYCDIPAGTVSVTDNTHDVLYIANDCSVNTVSIQTYIQTPISPGGIADFGNVVAYNGNTEVVNGIGLENKRIIKLRKLLLQSSGQHLSVVNGGLNIQLNGTYGTFNVTSGQYVYLMDIVPTTKQQIGINPIEVVSPDGAGGWLHIDQYKLNTTSCTDGTNTITCTDTNKYRRTFIFVVDNNESGTDNTGIHQVLPNENVKYINLADCLSTATNPITYTLPSYYQYSAVPLYFYCSKASDTAWVSTNWVSIKSGTPTGSGGGGSTDTSGLVPYTSATNNVDLNGKNLTNATSLIVTNGTTKYSSILYKNILGLGRQLITRNWGINYDVITGGNGSAIMFQNNQNNGLYLMSGLYYNGTDWVYTHNKNGSVMYFTNAGGLVFYSTSGGSPTSAETSATINPIMRIDSNGNLSYNGSMLVTGLSNFTTDVCSNGICLNGTNPFYQEYLWNNTGTDFAIVSANATYNNVNATYANFTFTVPRSGFYIVHASIPGYVQSATTLDKILYFKLQDTLATDETVTYGRPCFIGKSVESNINGDLLATTDCTYRKYYTAGTTVSIYLKYRTSLAYNSEAGIQGLLFSIGNGALDMWVEELR